MKYYVIGLSDSTEQYFPEEVLRVIHTHRIFSGGMRHHERVGSLLPQGAEWIDIRVPLDDVFTRYRSHDEMVIFASGDPLFFGFANTLQQRMPEAVLVLYPTFNSLQMLAHQLQIPYHDMRVVSLTGRPWHAFDQALIEGASMLGILTDSREHTPDAIAKRMIDYGYTHYTLYVGEHLGNRERQQIRLLTLDEAIRIAFDSPNCLLLIAPAKGGRMRPFGLPDTLFDHLDGREKMITKMPIRLLSLSMLDLRSCSHFWDIGFCTGSVSIEAKLQFPHLHITAFEIRETGRRLMEANSRRFGAPGIETVIGDFCAADLSGMEAPDAVFIGGHGGRLLEIVARVTQRLAPGGILLFNSVSEESRDLFSQAANRAGLNIVQQTQITIDQYNTITIIKAVAHPLKEQNR